MRVITGAARGRKLESVQGFKTRPTSDRIKESMFNIIQFNIEGRLVLDLFAGSGQLGIEALSRGAREAVFVDLSADAVKTVRSNIKLTCFDKVASVFQTDFRTYLQSANRKFDLIFADPPYGSDYCKKVLELAVSFDILSSGAIIVCETSDEAELPSDIGYELRQYHYGKKKISVYTNRCE